MVALLQDGHQRHRLRGHAAGGRQSGATTFQCGHPFLKRCHGGVGEARVHIAEGLQVKQTCRVVGTVEHKAGGLVDGQRARAGGTVRHLTGVDRERLGLELVV